MKPLTQQMVADAVGVTQPTVQRWMKGDASPKGEELLKLATLFKVDPYALMYDDRPLPEALLLREVPGEALVDDALKELDDLKEKVQSLDRAMRRLKTKTTISSTRPTSEAQEIGKRAGDKYDAGRKK